MIKRINSLILAVILLFSLTCSVMAEEKEPRELVFNSYSDWTTQQGNRCWYYQYTSDGTYSGYKDMNWTTKGSNTTFHGMNAAGGVVDNFYIKQSIMHIGGAKLNAARVWVAPYSGVVHISSDGNVRKTSTWTGDIINANIVKTNSKQKNEEVLWSKEIKPGDNVGTGNTYNFNINVTRGDRIYFEVAGSNTANAAVEWKTNIEYLQAVYFSKNGNTVKSMSELSANDTLNCCFYDAKIINKDAKLFLVVYDEKGCMRALSSVSQIDVDNWNERKAEVSVLLPSDSEDNDYTGWSVKLTAIINLSNRFWPLSISDTIMLK